MSAYQCHTFLCSRRLSEYGEYAASVSHSYIPNIYILCLIHTCVWPIVTLMSKNDSKGHLTWQGWNIYHEWVNFVCNSQMLTAQSQHSCPPAQGKCLQPTYSVRPTWVFYLSYCPLAFATGRNSEGPIWWQQLRRWNQCYFQSLPKREVVKKTDILQSGWS